MQRIHQRLHPGTRGVSAVIGAVILIGIVVVLSAVLLIGATQLTPDEGYTAQPQGAFEYERDNGTIRVYPTQISQGAQFDLVVKGKEVYTWEGGNATEIRELRCLYPGDTVRIVNDAGERTYLNSEWEVQSPTKCPIEGTEQRFATVMVEDNKEPIFAPQYEFTLKVAPDANEDSYSDLNEDNIYPVTNQWHYVKRYNKTIEGFKPPVYVIVLADNAQYGQSPEEVGETVAQTYDINEDNEIVNTGQSPEPTNDVYMVFRPGCDSSKLKFISESASYDNTVILGDEVIIKNTNNVADGKVFDDISGVECVAPPDS